MTALLLVISTEVEKSLQFLGENCTKAIGECIQLCFRISLCGLVTLRLVVEFDILSIR